MKQLTLSKKRKLLSALREYRKKYLTGKYDELDESATRIMLNSFLNDVLGFKGLDEVKTEYMIRGTYADYIVQLMGKRYFIVEVKSLGIELSAKHLRQVVNYAANEGIDWALLTNGRVFQVYRIMFTKPIGQRKVFEVDLAEKNQLRSATDLLQYLTRALITQHGLDTLWHRFSALDPASIAKLFCSKPVVNYIKRELKRAHKTKFSDEEIRTVITSIVGDQAVSASPAPRTKHKKRRKGPSRPNATLPAPPDPGLES